MRRIYLDHAATTPLDPRVLDAMLPALTGAWGNPSTPYWEGREARRLLDRARRQLAELLGVRPNEVVLTSGGSEADGLAIRGAVEAAGNVPHVVTSAVEHHAVLHTVEALVRARRCNATVVPVDGEGAVDPVAVADAVRDDTALVSVMLANNEVGTVQPVAEIARAVRIRNPRTLIHTDAVQAAGALPLHMAEIGVDLLSLAAHKFYGPKGVGALLVRAGTRLTAQALGGSQERNRRAGTENVVGAVGMATALRLALDEREAHTAHEAGLRDRLLRELPARIPGLRVNGPKVPGRRLANNVNVCLPHIDSQTAIMHLDLNGIAVSSGSACTTGSMEPSHVLLAMGVPAGQARCSLRLTVGRDTTEEDIDRLLAVLVPFATGAGARLAAAR